MDNIGFQSGASQGNLETSTENIVSVVEILLMEY